MKQSIYKSKDELPMYLTVIDVGISCASAYDLVRKENLPRGWTRRRGMIGIKKERKRYD